MNKNIINNNVIYSIYDSQYVYLARYDVDVFSGGAWYDRVFQRVNESLDDSPLGPIAHDDVDLAYFHEFSRISLRVTTRGNDGGIGVLATGRPERVSCFAVSDMRNCARIQHKYIGLLVYSDNLKTGGAELPGQSLGIRLIELATVSFDSHFLLI